MKYDLKVGDVVQVKESGYGFPPEDVGKWVEIVKFGTYTSGCKAVFVKLYDEPIFSKSGSDGKWFCGFETFGENPMILLNTLEDQEPKEKEYSLKHYDTFYHLTDKDIEQGKIKIDAYFVAKQWKVGSKDDSGALFHNLKTIARFGEKNSIEREIKALYNQTLALARIYNVELD